MFEVITVKSGLPDESGDYKEFHFRNEEKKERFIQTLYSHRLSDIGFTSESEWKEPSRDLLIEMDKDPIEYAKDNVFWAKNTIRNYMMSHLTGAELAYLHKMA